MRPINVDNLKIDSWKTLEDAIFDITHAPTMDISKKYEKCMHYDTCKGSTVTMCGKRWSDEGCSKELPMTNADHIRSMSDEELACYLALIEDLKSGEIAFKDTSGKWLEWLKQPKEKEG